MDSTAQHRRLVGIPPRSIRLEQINANDLNEIEIMRNISRQQSSTSSKYHRSNSLSQNRSFTQNRDSSPSRSRNRSRGRSPGPSKDNGAVERWSSSHLYNSSEAWRHAPIAKYDESDHNGPPTTVVIPPLLPPRTPTHPHRPPLSGSRSHHTNGYLRNTSSFSPKETSSNAVSRNRHRSYSPAPSHVRKNQNIHRGDLSRTGSNTSSTSRGRKHSQYTDRDLRRKDSNGSMVSNSSRNSETRKSRVRTRSNSITRSLRGNGTLSEKFFGDQPPKDRVVKSNAHSPIPPESILPRTPLSSSVFHNPTSGLWIATINTHQRSEGGKHSAKHVRAFSYPSEEEAKQSALANSPPRMLPFDDYPNCFVCHGRFAIFRRASHCRNCGVCVCSSCSTSWPSKMIPETFNIKNEKTVTICKSCNWLSRAFKQALSKGEMDKVAALYSTGNINLRCPFKNVKGEIMFPVHCAVVGGNLNILKWLVEVHYCPIRLVHTSNKIRKSMNNPLLTSKGRSVMSIAMEDNKINILRYLVVEKQMSIYETKDLNLALGMLDSVLKMPSEDTRSNNIEFLNNAMMNPTEFQTGNQYDGHSSRQGHNRRIQQEPEQYEYQNEMESSAPVLEEPSSQQPETVEANNANEEEDDDKTVTTVSDACILCYENEIDCVITPCGHQICCLQCSQSLKNCPVCNAKGSFIKIYKP